MTECKNLINVEMAGNGIVLVPLESNSPALPWGNVCGLGLGMGMGQRSCPAVSVLAACGLGEAGLL